MTGISGHLATSLHPRPDQIPNQNSSFQGRQGTLRLGCPGRIHGQRSDPEAWPERSQHPSHDWNEIPTWESSQKIRKVEPEKSSQLVNGDFSKKNVWNTSWGTSTQEGFQEISPLPGSDWNLLPALSSPSLPEGWRHPMADWNHLPGSTLPMLLETSCHPSFGWNVLPRRVFAVCWGAGDWREATVYLQSWRSVTVWAVGHSLSSAWSHAPRSSSVGYLVDSEDSGWNKNQTPNAAGHLGTPHLPEVDWINLIRTSSGNHPILRSMCSSKIKTTRSTRIHHAKWELRRNKCCAHNLSYNTVLPI